MNKRLLLLLSVLCFLGLIFIGVVIYTTREEKEKKSNIIEPQDYVNTEVEPEDPFSDLFQKAFQESDTSFRDSDVPQGIKKEAACIVEGQIVAEGTIISGGTCVSDESQTQ